MANKGQRLLRCLEKHIQKLGQEYSRMALDFFWMEEDIRGWLFGKLLKDSKFTYTIDDLTVPIVHAQYPTGSAQKKKQFYDLAVVEPDDAKLIAERKKVKSQNDFKEQHARLLAAVEIAFLYQGGTEHWKGKPGEPGKLEKDVNKLIENKAQFNQGYLLVFVLTKFQQCQKQNYDEVKGYLSDMANKSWKQKAANLKIYCAAGPGSAAGNVWI